MKKLLKRIFCCITISIIVLLLSQVCVFAITKSTTNSNNTSNATNTSNKTNSSNNANTRNNTNSNNSTNSKNNSTNNATKNNTTNNTNTTNSNTNNTNNDLSENEISEDELIPALEEKLKQEQEEALENDEELADGIDDKEIIDEDIYLFQVDSDKEYENNYIEGNVYIISSEKISFDDCIILGNLYVISDEFEMNETEVTGTVYVFGENIIISSSNMSYAYMVSDEIEFDEDVEIENDLRIFSNSATINGTIGRDLISVTSFIELCEDIEIERNISVSTETYEIPSSLKNSSNFELEIIENEEFDISDLNTILISSTIVEFIVILIIALIILGGSPKFSEVNKYLRLRDFFKTFFTGILEIIIIDVIAVLLISTGYGLGFGIAIILFMLFLIYFGKIVFIASFAIRSIKNKDKYLKAKSFAYTIIIGAIVELISFVSILISGGFMICAVFNLILGVTGFGTFVKIILTSGKIRKVVNENYNSTYVEGNMKIETSAEVKKEDAEEVKKSEDEIKIEEIKSNDESNSEKLDKNDNEKSDDN